MLVALDAQCFEDVRRHPGKLRTRVHEDTKKFFFTLIDFRGATSHFADPDFDGDPVQIYEAGDGDPFTPPDDAPQGDDTIPPAPGDDEAAVDQPGLPLPPGAPNRKIYVDGVGARILAERVEYLDENGKLVTESLRDFTKTALKKRWPKSCGSRVTGCTPARR